MFAQKEDFNGQMSCYGGKIYFQHWDRNIFMTKVINGEVKESISDLHMLELYDSPRKTFLFAPPPPFPQDFQDFKTCYSLKLINLSILITCLPYNVLKVVF